MKFCVAILLGVLKEKSDVLCTTGNGKDKLLRWLNQFTCLCKDLNSVPVGEASNVKTVFRDLSIAENTLISATVI